MIQVDRYTHVDFTSNTYLIQSSGFNECWLIDAGSAISVISNLRLEQKIVGVFLTHAHYDHIYELKDVVAKYPKAVIYCSEFCKQSLEDSRKNLSFYHEEPISLVHDVICEVKEGVAIKYASGDSLHVYHTPGHTPGCLSFGFLDFLFTGDSYIPGVKPITKLKGGNKEKSRHSVERIKVELLNKFKIVMPGHKIN